MFRQRKEIVLFNTIVSIISKYISWCHSFYFYIYHLLFVHRAFFNVILVSMLIERTLHKMSAPVYNDNKFIRTDRDLVLKHPMAHHGGLLDTSLLIQPVEDKPLT